ncbi:conjugal transfer protein MobA [Dysgonomonas sp. UBA7698]|uniref:conjugal transfer protein MobA n=1 Tax=Dysgonomonas sp. UBA7698 TaxID=1946427 RepID=UPI0025C42F99|nr:conjugal transfer protein MobA [Dysgonomonas sp. UBA7698]
MDKSKAGRSKYKGGRKPIDDPAVFRYSIKLNSVDNARFEELFLRSGLTEKSKFIKAMIFEKEIKVVKIDRATLDYYMRLTNIYSQYKAVGVNYNQTVKAIKANFGDKRAMSLLYKLEKETIKLVGLSQEILRLSKEFEENYLNI